MHAYEVRPRKDKRGVDLISDVLPFGRLWYVKPDDAVSYANFSSHSHDAVIRVCDATWQRDRNARAQGRFQGMGSALSNVERLWRQLVELRSCKGAQPEVTSSCNKYLTIK
jgi:hypothetical protein